MPLATIVEGDARTGTETAGLGDQDRGVVAAASYEVRAYGVRLFVPAWETVDVGAVGIAVLALLAHLS